MRLAFSPDARVTLNIVSDWPIDVVTFTTAVPLPTGTVTVLAIGEFDV